MTHADAAQDERSLVADTVVAAPAEAEKLVLGNLSLAEAVARRYFRRDRARDEDLVQVAYIGLMKAARRFEPGRGTSFAAFAVPTISGEIKRHLRDNGWFIRPPRQVQELWARISEASPRLAQQLGHRPSVAEFVADLGESERRVQEAIACQDRLRPASLDVTVGEDQGATLAELIPGTGEDLERAELGAVLSAAMRTLSPRDRRVVHLRFFEDRTQQEIATELGVTQMQISRILSKALPVLRDRIQNGAPARARSVA
ncbi:sigma-70 family RNA polymerase sigma factor [Microbacterium sp. LRZ72]|uniref:sigma-70 family RNA polymerase sigma factor n=1 Tax=Microbacterium sp. LRZ72 TaxID=2942481 RepID=UPI0029B8B02E|nr:sigma-70 family RNA polymerase sigma factor [Microbacterium sp. LRZ72]MDX2376739.1 sigma-70 family RNA polymerase sigma factor [Microbacterium sp. LRZ72]